MSLSSAIRIFQRRLKDVPEIQHSLCILPPVAITKEAMIAPRPDLTCGSRNATDPKQFWWWERLPHFIWGLYGPVELLIVGAIIGAFLYMSIWDNTETQANRWEQLLLVSLPVGHK